MIILKQGKPILENSMISERAISTEDKQIIYELHNDTGKTVEDISVISKLDTKYWHAITPEKILPHSIAPLTIIFRTSQLWKDEVKPDFTIDLEYTEVL